MSLQDALGVALILVALAIPVIIIVLLLFFAIRFRHKQIMAAIEKGTPLSELRPLRHYGASWIRNITIGIMMLGIGLALIFAGPESTDSPALFGAIVVFGIGIAWIVRGLLNRKYSAYGVQIQPPQKEARGAIDDGRN